MAAKKRERHGLKAASKVMLESHGKMAAHMPRLEGRQKSKDSETRPQPVQKRRPEGSTHAAGRRLAKKQGQQYRSSGQPESQRQKAAKQVMP